MMENKEMNNICPVCDEYTFAETDSHETCPVCGWVNDAYQTEHIFVRHSANKFSLAQSKKAWRLLNLCYEVGYGIDNLQWGVGFETCKLCNQRVCVDECKYKIQQILNGEKPDGVENLEKAKAICTHCILRNHEILSDVEGWGRMASKPCGRDTYGSGEWGAGPYEYDLTQNNKILKSLIDYCHNEAPQGPFDNSPRPDEPNFDEKKDLLMTMMAEDEQGRRNYHSYFYKPVLSIAEYIEYCKTENGYLDNRFSLWAFGDTDEEKYEFTKDTKKRAERVLHLSLSFMNYKCGQFGEPGFYYLDNEYQGWEPDEFDDTIAAWFVDIGDDLDEDAIKEFVTITLAESFSFNHVKLALHLLSRLDYAKGDAKLQKLLQLYALVPSLQPLVKKCIV